MNWGLVALSGVCFAAGCSPASTAPTGGPDAGAEARDEDAPTGDASADGAARACLLAPSNLATLSLSGSACGETISYQSPAALQIELGRSSIAGDVNVVTSIRAGDLTAGASGTDPGYFDTHDVLFSLTLASGPGYAQGSGSYPLASGSAWACGLGSMAFGAGSVTISFQQLVDTGNGGTIQATIDGIPVAGFTTAFGTTQVPACAGTLRATLQGPWSKKL